MTKSFTVLNKVEELSTTQIKEHIVRTITNNINIVDNLKDVLELFECNGVENLSDYENEQRETIYLSLEDLSSEIYYLSQLVDYYEIMGSRIKKMCDTLHSKGTYEETLPNGHIQQYIKDYEDGTYRLDFSEVA